MKSDWAYASPKKEEVGSAHTSFKREGGKQLRVGIARKKEEEERLRKDRNQNLALSQMIIKKQKGGQKL